MSAAFAEPRSGNGSWAGDSGERARAGRACARALVLALDPTVESSTPAAELAALAGRDARSVLRALAFVRAAGRDPARSTTVRSRPSSSRSPRSSPPRRRARSISPIEIHDRRLGTPTRAGGCLPSRVHGPARLDRRLPVGTADRAELRPAEPRVVLQSFLSAAEELGELVESVTRRDACERTAVVGGQTVCAAE